MRILCLLFFLPAYAFSAALVTKDIKIDIVSAYSDGGNVLVQTNPRHSIQDLGCESDYWLTLNPDVPGYQTLLSMLLSAHATQQPVSVVVDDTDSTKFCKLTRLSLNH